MHAPLEFAVRRIRALAGSPTDTASDGDLLARFVATRDDAAFATLVERHGPTVLGVCQRILRDHHSADDAFQATFLVLARRAATVRNSASVGAWLHGVAVRIASKLKAQLLRLPRTGTIPERPMAGDDLSWREVRCILDEEVARLPERLRQPILLCYFEGRTRDEAAVLIGCKITTLRGRLEDARGRLQTRLVRRGIDLSAALLAISAADSCAIGEGLLGTTVESAKGAATTAVKALAEGAMAMAAIGQVKWIAVAMLVATLVIGTTATVYRSAFGEPPTQSPTEGKPTKPTANSPKPKADAWGEAAGDFQLRLKALAPLEVGKMPDLVCDLKNVGKEKRTVHGITHSTEVELDGHWYSSHREGSFGGRTIELAAEEAKSPWLTVRPDALWIHLKDNPDPEKNKEAVPFRLPVGMHKVRVAYRLSEKERAVSNAVDLEILPDGWGNATLGVKSRLRLTKTKFKAGEPLTFELDLRNVGENDIAVLPIPFLCDIQFDRFPYRYMGELDYKASKKQLKAGATLSPFVSVAADKSWKVVMPTPALGNDAVEQYRGREGLELTPGKHTLEVTYPIVDKVGPISNTVTFEVEAPPLDPVIATLAASSDRIWVVPSPTRDKPVPIPTQVIKGPAVGATEFFDLRLLPAADPTKSWIVFLQAEEDGQPRPAVKLFPGPTWYAENADGMAEAIRTSIQPTNWGPEQGGLQMGLRLRSAKLESGQPVVAEVTIRNVSKADITIEQHRFNFYDYWPNTKFTVKAPNGTTWTVAKPVGVIKRLDSPHPVTLKGGESYTQSMRLDRWIAHLPGLDDADYSTNVFTAPGEYVISCHYILPKDKSRSWAGSLASNEVRLTLEKKLAWGDESKGIQARVRLARDRFTAGDPLAFHLDLRNRGDKVFKGGSKDARYCTFVFDGTEYRFTGPINLEETLPLIRLAAREERVPFVTVTTDKDWQIPIDLKRWYKPILQTFTLKPGKHTLRVRYPVGEKSSAESQTITFTVEEADWGAPSQGIQARLRLAKAKFLDSDPLSFELDVRNQGKKNLDEAPRPELCEIELDGVIYTEHSEKAPPEPKTQSLSLNAQIDGWLKVTTNEWWANIRPGPGPGGFGAGQGGTGFGPGEFGKPAFPPAVTTLALTPGKHKVRVSYQMRSDKTIRVVTPLVEFTVEPDPWGKAAEGIQTRVRLAQTKVREGDRLAFELDLRNRSGKPFSECPNSDTCEIEFDGKIYHRFPINLLNDKVLTVGQNEERSGWIKHTTNEFWRLWAFGQPADELVLVPGKHSLRVIYQMTTPNPMKPISQTLEFVVDPLPAGKSVEGVRARLRTNKDVWNAGESPQFDFDLTNEGKSAWKLLESDRNCLLEVDGVWYENETGRVNTADGAVVLRSATPWQTRFSVFADAPRTSGGSWIVMLPDDPIRPAPDSQKLKLKPGKHTIRVAYFILKVSENNKESPPELRIETNAVEIEIRTADRKLPK